jgi:hypothetical protein
MTKRRSARSTHCEIYRDKLELIHFGYQLWVRKTAD